MEILAPIEDYPFKKGQKVKHYDMATDTYKVSKWPITNNPFHINLSGIIELNKENTQ